MKRILRKVYSASLMAIVFFSSTPTALADPSKATPKDPVVWQDLDPSNPQHAAIIGWHKALTSSDYDSYLSFIPRIAIELNTASKSRFNAKSETTPHKILIASESQYTNPNGSKDYGVAGCGKWQLFGDDRQVRLVAMVTPVMENGKWKISASDFAPPWNNLVRVCPEK